MRDEDGPTRDRAGSENERCRHAAAAVNEPRSPVGPPTTVSAAESWTRRASSARPGLDQPSEVRQFAAPEASARGYPPGPTVARDVETAAWNLLTSIEPGVGADVVFKSPALQGRRPLAKHPVQLVDEEIYRPVGVITRDASLEIGAADFNVPLGREATRAPAMIKFDVDAEPEDPRFMTE